MCGRTPHLKLDSVAAAAAAEAASDALAPACSAEPPWAVRKEGRDSGYPAGDSAAVGSSMAPHLESSGPLVEGI